MSDSPLVLIADDCEHLRALLREVVCALGCEAEEAPGGRAALLRVRDQMRRRPDLLLLDLERPGMGGLEILGALAAGEELRHLPCIGISGASAAELAEACACGARASLAEPLRQEQLSALPLRHLPSPWPEAETPE